MNRPCRNLGFRAWLLAGAGTLVLLVAGCGTPAPPAADRPSGAVSRTAGALAPLYPLDESTAGEFRRAFDEGKDRIRLIVALSPT